MDADKARMNRRVPGPLHAALTSPAAGIYFLVQRTRELAYELGLLRPLQSPIPVISVGNILMGGSGKTPFTIFLAEGLAKKGFKPAVVTRGYKGTYQSPFLVVRDAIRLVTHDWRECGDEPYLMALKLDGIPVLAARRRVKGIQVAAARFLCDCATLDDGFQHLQCARNLDIVLLTGLEDRMFPLGLLREPLSALGRANLFVLTGKADPGRELSPLLQGRPLFRAWTEPLEVITGEGPLPVSALRGESVTLVSGIANPDRFARTVASLGASVKHHLIFPDHHPISAADIREVLATRRDGWVLCTEKDWIKLPNGFRNGKRTAALRIGVRLEQEEAFWPIALAACRPPSAERERSPS